MLEFTCSPFILFENSSILITHSIIFHRNLWQPHWSITQNLLFSLTEKLCHICFSPVLWYSPLFPSLLRTNNGWFRSFIRQVSPSLQWSSSQPGHLVVWLPTYHWHQFPLKLGCSTLSSLKLIVFDTEDKQNRNRVVLLSSCRLLSPSVSSREPTLPICSSCSLL